MGNWYKKKNTILVDGAKLSAARVNANLSMDDVANHLGCNKSSVSRWEQGTLNPSEERIMELVKLYRCGDFIREGNAK